VFSACYITCSLVLWIYINISIASIKPIYTHWPVIYKMACAAECFEGLYTAKIDPEIAQEALKEMQVLLDNSGTRRHSTASEMVEIGACFISAKQGKHSVVKHSLCDFPAIMRLITLSMNALGSVDRDLQEDRLNVIIRRYNVGQGLKMHTDRTSVHENMEACFEEPVFGCVLENTSPQALTFKHGAHTLELQEDVGTVFLQTGHARFWCQHGVPLLTAGRRVSLTWRWFVGF